MKKNNWELKELLMQNKKLLLPALELAEENNNIVLQEWIKDILLMEKMSTSNIKREIFFPSQINNFILRSKEFEHLKGKRIMFYGPPGVGKTFAANTLSKKLNTEIKTIKYNDIISKRMGDTMKNLEMIFMNSTKEIIFLDEVDVILTNRIGSDIDEMKRVTGNFLWLLDNLPDHKILIMATNIIGKVDEAIIRRIDFNFNFNQYESSDLTNIYREELRGRKFYEKSKNDKYLSDSFFSKKILKLILNTEGLTPFSIKKSIDNSEEFFMRHGENNYFYMVEPFIKKDFSKNIKENIVIQLRDFGFSINEIFIILKNEFSISNDNIRKIVKEAEHES